MQNSSNQIQKFNKNQFKDWLLTSIPFSIWRCSNKKHIIEARNHIFKEIGEEYRHSRYKSRDQEMLLNFVNNLWVGFCCGCPIQISRNKNKYSKSGVYSKVHFTYERMDRIFWKLVRHGYMQYTIGYFTEEDARETRIWATEKLIRLFVDDFKFNVIGDIYTERTVNQIQLRNEIKKSRINKVTGKKRKVKFHKSVKIDDTDATLMMRKDLETYNNLAEENTVSVKIHGDDLITPKFLTDVFLTGLVSGAITLTDSALDYKNPKDHQFYNDDIDSSKEPVSSVFTHLPGLMITSLSYDQYKIPILSVPHHKEPHVVLDDIDSLLSPITHTLYSQQWQGFQKKLALFLYVLYIKKILSLMKMKGRNDKDRKKRRKKLMETERPLIDFGIRHLEFEINKKSLHRVFNRASLEFDKGGRFYGPLYQGISSQIRKYIQINGNDTVEVDYSGMHIRMLYHQQGQEYTADPYNIGKKSERAKYKLVSLISINAEKNEAPGAIKEILDGENIRYGSGSGCITKLMDNYRDYHDQIKDYLFSGAGVELQNTDSNIMNEILAELSSRGIVGLPIHDSIIVEKQHQELLETLMVEKYQKRMNGFAPVLKVA